MGTSMGGAGIAGLFLSSSSNWASSMTADYVCTEEWVMHELKWRDDRLNFDQFYFLIDFLMIAVVRF